MHVYYVLPVYKALQLFFSHAHVSYAALVEQ